MPTPLDDEVRKPHHRGKEDAPQIADDPVEEASEESFPASDPPASNGGEPKSGK